ncbi:alpha/beta hydrolase [Roseibium algae]|uniref:Alpha/beta hydrolase n=1 Tax=Roseibium algae TaxID=3123038 RepID=A0ABU8TG21_9HYPH
MTLIDHPENPVPEGSVSGFVKTVDGVDIRYAHWPSLGGLRRGTVTILQGRAEFIEKYFEVIQDLRQRGFSVIAFDWRGQGGSERLLGNRRKGHIRNFSQYRTDLYTVLKRISLAEYAGPHFALAHSTGGAILLSDAIRLRTMLDRVVLGSPLTGVIDNGWLEKILFRLAVILKWVGMGRLFLPGGKADLFADFEGNRQTSDERRFDRANAVLRLSPELGIGSPTIGWFYAVAGALQSFRKRGYGPSVSLPCLVIAAGNDRIVSTPATEELVSRLKAAGYLEIAGAEHELLMERDEIRDQFWAAFDAFIPGQAGGLV